MEQKYISNGTKFGNCLVAKRLNSIDRL